FFSFFHPCLPHSIPLSASFTSSTSLPPSFQPFLSLYLSLCLYSLAHHSPHCIPRLSLSPLSLSLSISLSLFVIRHARHLAFPDVPQPLVLFLWFPMASSYFPLQ